MMLLRWDPKWSGRTNSLCPYGRPEGWEPISPKGIRCSKGKERRQKALLLDSTSQNSLTDGACILPLLVSVGHASHHWVRLSSCGRRLSARPSKMFLLGGQMLLSRACPVCSNSVQLNIISILITLHPKVIYFLLFYVIAFLINKMRKKGKTNIIVMEINTLSKKWEKTHIKSVLTKKWKKYNKKLTL